jgi:hypothetical protein
MGSTFGHQGEGEHMERQNCWEFKNCGREPNGRSARDLGICAAATTTKLDGIHRGMNGGRSCWAVAGTLCDGVVQGIFASKLPTCLQCDFYKEVLTEERRNRVSSEQLLAMLRS